MNVIVQILILIGSLGLFLYGMTVMSEALQKVAGERLRNILASMTSNPFKRILTGVLVTAVIQSSSATTVMVVSFVNAGLLTLTQSIGVIMGANIGTTVTAWIISLLGFQADISSLSIPLIGIGFVLMMFKSNKRKNLGELFIGFALLFLGLSYLKDAVPNLEQAPEVLAFIQSWTSWGFWSVLIFVGIGTVLTIVLQSSSATMALTLVMCNFGWIPFEMAAAMVLGENIGTTITANIAASVANVSAKRAARAHSVFNIVGVIWVLILFKPFLLLVSKVVVLIGGANPFESTESILWAVAMVHTLFNVCNTFIMVWFTPQIVKLVTWMVKAPEEEEVFRLKYIHTGLLSTSELSLEQAKREIVYFGTLMKRQFGYVRQAVDMDASDGFEELFKKVESYEQISDRIEFEIAKYLTDIGDGQLSEESAKRTQAMYKIISELESVGDSGYNIVRLIQRKNLRDRKNFDERIKKNIYYMLDLLDAAFDAMVSNLSDGYTKLVNINNAEDAENAINDFRDDLKDEHIANLESNAYPYPVGVYYMDIIGECEKTGDFIINVSEAIMEIKY